VLASVSNLSVHDPILIYAFLALYGLLTVLLITHVHWRFRTAARTLKMLQAEWESAESNHATCVGVAKEKLSKLKVVAPAGSVPSARPGVIGADMRNQIVAMASHGTPTSDIARTCNLHEGEVEVILGMSRLHR
jgi:hypothetical protein